MWMFKNKERLKSGDNVKRITISSYFTAYTLPESLLNEESLQLLSGSTGFLSLLPLPLFIPKTTLASQTLLLDPGPVFRECCLSPWKGHYYIATIASHTCIRVPWTDPGCPNYPFCRRNDPRPHMQRRVKRAVGEIRLWNAIILNPLTLALSTGCISLKRYFDGRHGKIHFHCPVAGCFQGPKPTSFTRSDRLTAHIRPWRFRDVEGTCPADDCKRMLSLELLWPNNHPCSSTHQGRKRERDLQHCLRNIVNILYGPAANMYQ